MRFSEARGRTVMSTSTAETVGKVDGFLVDAATRCVVGLRLKKTPGDRDTVAWADLAAFGVDAVTVADVDRLQIAEGRLAELQGKERSLLGKRLLEESGDELGEVEDVEFDAATGALTLLRTKTEEVDAGRLRGVGSYAVVVTRG
jgi:sporulation protein YlmC with PRC-barrel domain